MCVSILPVFKCRTGCVPEAGSNSQWCPSDPCPSKLWQKELLFSHRPGGPCPLGEASPRDWQLRKHSQPRGDGVRAHHCDALAPPFLPTPPWTSHLCLSIMTCSTLSLLTLPSPGGVTCKQLTKKQQPPTPLYFCHPLYSAKPLFLPVIFSIFF